MQEDLISIERRRRNQRMVEQAFDVMHQIFKRAQDGDKEAKKAIKQNKANLLRMQNEYPEFKQYKI
jgi:hypothetical protein